METTSLIDETALSVVLPTLDSVELARAQVADLAKFASKHVVQRTDTLAMLAIKHGVDVELLKRVNNIMSDHSLYSRSVVYIPVRHASQLVGKTAHFERCSRAGRDFIVVTVEADTANAPVAAPQHERLTKGACWDAQHRKPPQGARQLSSKLSALMGRSLHVDEHTAAFYLAQADGDLKEAMTLFEQDLAWEASTGPVVRKAPILKFLAGDGLCLPVD